MMNDIRTVTVGVISINREENNAYIWITKDNPYWSTNVHISLIALEYKLGLTFNEKYGWFWISFKLTEKEWEQLYALKN